VIIPEKAHMLRCASTFVVAAYGKNTPHFSGLARLASGAFCGVIKQKIVILLVVSLSFEIEVV